MTGRPNQPSNPWARLRWPALLLTASLIYGVLAYMLIEGWSFIDAAYMVTQTMTTVGLGPSRPLDTSGELITLSLMLLGVTLVVITLSLAAAAIADGGLGERRRRRKLQSLIDKLDDHYIVCAYGRVGRTVARELEAEEKPCVVVDSVEDLEDRMRDDGVLYIIGDPTEERILHQAGVERAHALICAVDSDAASVYITLTARSMNPDIFIVARASEARSAERLYKAGANRVISPYVTSGRHMAMQAVRPRVLEYLEIGRDSAKMRLEEVFVEAGSELVGRSVAEISGKAMPLAVQRGDGTVVPSPPPDFRVQPGDLLLIMGRAEELRTAAAG